MAGFCMLSKYDISEVMAGKPEREVLACELVRMLLVRYGRLTPEESVMARERLRMLRKKKVREACGRQSGTRSSGLWMDKNDTGKMRPADAGRKRGDLRKNENASKRKNNESVEFWQQAKTERDVLPAVCVSCRQRN